MGEMELCHINRPIDISPNNSAFDRLHRENRCYQQELAQLHEIAQIAVAEPDLLQLIKRLSEFIPHLVNATQIAIGINPSCHLSRQEI